MIRAWRWGPLLIFGFLCLLCVSQRADAAVRIHYIGLEGPTDAILLEDHGRFAMVDSGEDWDFPFFQTFWDPSRIGTDIDHGYDQQVIYYLKAMGVNKDNFDFYVGSHSHSDHIGLGDDIIRAFHPAKVYLKKYSDSHIVRQEGLWDNQKVYDDLRLAAKEEGIPLVQDFTEGMEVCLGENTKLRFWNTEVNRRVLDDNFNSLIIEVEAYQWKTLLTADMEAYTARKLLAEGKLGHMDIVKSLHHGYYNNNPVDIYQSLNPKMVVVTGDEINYPHETIAYLQREGKDFRSVYAGGASIVTEFTTAGYHPVFMFLQPGWLTWRGGSYYMNERGRPVRGWEVLDGKDCLFDDFGRLVPEAERQGFDRKDLIGQAEELE